MQYDSVRVAIKGNSRGKLEWWKRAQEKDRKERWSTRGELMRPFERVKHWWDSAGGIKTKLHKQRTGRERTRQRAGWGHCVLCCHNSLIYVMCRTDGIGHYCLLQSQEACQHRDMQEYKFYKSFSPSDRPCVNILTSGNCKKLWFTKINYYQNCSIHYSHKLQKQGQSVELSDGPWMEDSVISRRFCTAQHS